MIETISVTDHTESLDELEEIVLDKPEMHGTIRLIKKELQEIRITLSSCAKGSFSVYLLAFLNLPCHKTQCGIFLVESGLLARFFHNG